MTSNSEILARYIWQDGDFDLEETSDSGKFVATKHMPGGHDQATHARGIPAGITPAQAMPEELKREIELFLKLEGK